MNQLRTGEAAVIERYSFALYFTAALLLLLPPLDTFFGLSNFEWTQVRWRFGALGLLTTALAVPLAGFLLGVLTATITRNIWMQRVLIGIGLVTTIVLTAALGLFMLDALQVRREVNPASLGQFNITVTKSVVTQVVQIAGFLIVTIMAFRNRDRRRAQEEARQSPLVSTSRTSATV